MGNVTLSKDNIAQDLDQKDILSVIPEEVLVHILSYLPGKHLIHVCRVVCKLWKAIIDSASLWIRKCEREGVVIPPTAHSLQLDFRVLYLKNPYGRNLLRNWNAEGKCHSSRDVASILSYKPSQPQAIFRVRPHPLAVSQH